MCLSADSSQTWTVPHFSDDAAALYKSASEVSSPPGSDAIVLDEENSYVFDAQGRTVQTRYLLYKVLTQSGVEGWSQVLLDWEPWHEDRPTVRARVITPDNVVHLLDQKTLVDAPGADSDNDVYTDARVVRGPLPAILPGSLVEEEDTWTENKPLFDAGTVRRYYFGRIGVPVHDCRLVLDAPASLPLHYETQLLPDAKSVRTEENGRVKVVFDSGPIEPLDQAEPNLPGDTPAFPNVAFSTGNSWRQVAENYGKIVSEQISLADVGPLVKQLTAGKQSREDKATALLQYLDGEIRYTGVEFGDAAITPRSPGEILKTKYGDCKDKATLLVAMLRAAGIPSYIALLNAGERQDIVPDLPGMGSFDHAIAFVPGSPELWIDATDQYARLGELPSDDQGRLALIARPESDALISTPVTSSQDNLLIEKREFYLSENGPARVVEISEPHGSLESAYRSRYADPADKDARKDLADYVQSQYLAEKLNHIDTSDPNNISKHFTLSLESDNAKRGITDLDSAVVAIRFDTLFSRLPNELEEHEKDDGKIAGGAGAKPKKIRTAGYQLPLPFVTEWQYKIVPPPGFRPKPLPANQQLSLGPATLAENFSADKDGVVRATIRFDTVKRVLSVSEAHEMRDQIVQLRDGAPIYIYFEPIAQALLNQGKIRESLQAYRDLVALHPTEALHHLQLAQAFLAAGLGQAARDEARRAVTLQPDSALAQKTLAKVLECDLVGRKLTPGSDYAGAEAAFRAARKLAPDDDSITGDFAIFLEYNSWGERYGPGAKLQESVTLYKSLTADELDKIGLKNNPAYTLFYAGQFPDALHYAESLNPQPLGVIVASEAAMNGSQAAISEASKRTSTEEDRKNILKAAGEMLMRLRMYPVAADLMEAGASGDNASNTMALASFLRKARPHENLHYGNDPLGIAMQAMIALTDPKLPPETLLDLYSKNARIAFDERDQEKRDLDARQHRQEWWQLSRSGFPADALLDVVMQSANAKVEGDDASAYRVTLQLPGRTNLTMYVVKEGNNYKYLGSSEDTDALGLEVLDRIAANNLAGARALLDWMRDSQHLAGGDDPLDGYVFPRIWTKGRDADAAIMKIAAAAMLVQTKQTARQGVSILEAAMGLATSDIDKLNISLALITGYRYLDDFQKILKLCIEIAKQYPESRREFLDQGFALRGLGRFQDADALAQERLKRIPDDIDAQRELVASAVAREDYDLAHGLSLKIVASDKAVAYDLNLAAWTALFTGRVTQEDLANATRAVQLSQNEPSHLHTLGCIYVEMGRTKEAREVLIQSMDRLNLIEPDPDYWYAFGRIAEQYGETETAKADYARVTKPARAMDIPDSSYRLAQNRLKILATLPVNGAVAKQ
jgi:tetratricopeptide (TPR) repeat protein